MTTTKIDRRIIRTRRVLREALFALITERGYDGLTITEITERADLRRATFYLHYADVDALLMASLHELFDELAQEIDSHPNAQPFYIPTQPAHIQPIFEYVAQNATLYRALIMGSAGSRVQRAIRDYLAQIKQRELAQLADLPMPIDVMSAYIASAETAMIVWWLENDLPYSPEQMATMVQTMLLEGLSRLRK